MLNSKKSNSAELNKNLIWSAKDLNFKEFLKNDYPNKERINLKDINKIADGNLVFEVKYFLMFLNSK